MCKYCEKQNVDGKMLREAIPTTSNCTSAEIVSCIIPKTPISVRKYKDTGTTAELEIGVFYDDVCDVTFTMPIRYCPICGRDLNK